MSKSRKPQLPVRTARARRAGRIPARAGRSAGPKAARKVAVDTGWLAVGVASLAGPHALLKVPGGIEPLSRLLLVNPQGELAVAGFKAKGRSLIVTGVWVINPAFRLSGAKLAVGQVREVTTPNVPPKAYYMASRL